MAALQKEAQAHEDTRARLAACEATVSSLIEAKDAAIEHRRLALEQATAVTAEKRAPMVTWPMFIWPMAV